MSNIRVLLADDHAIIREGLRSMIDSQPDMEVVGEADNGRAAWLKTKELRPDVVVMDVSMPEMNGAQAAERLREDCPDVKVLALTVHEDKGYLRRLLKTGASGYVLKRAAVDDLARALRVVASGGTYIDPALAERVVGGYLRTHSGAGDARRGELSDREVEVLRLIAWGHSNKEIAAQLDISVRTVETYKVRLMEKLDFHSRSEVVRYALQQGWMEEA